MVDKQHSTVPLNGSRTLGYVNSNKTGIVTAPSSKQTYSDQKDMYHYVPSASKSGLRWGKWTPEEEAYTNRLIDDFTEGILMDVDNGTTMRSWLSSKLNCCPMRISKKFVGKASIGKRMFERCEAKIEAISPQERKKRDEELERMYLEFLKSWEREEQERREALKNGGKKRRRKRKNASSTKKSKIDDSTTGVKPPLKPRVRSSSAPSISPPAFNEKAILHPNNKSIMEQMTETTHSIRCDKENLSTHHSTNIIGTKRPSILQNSMVKPNSNNFRAQRSQSFTCASTINNSPDRHWLLDIFPDMENENEVFLPPFDMGACPPQPDIHSAKQIAFTPESPFEEMASSPTSVLDILDENFMFPSPQLTQTNSHLTELATDNTSIGFEPVSFKFESDLLM